MTPAELHPILTAYRQTIQPAWSTASSHPGFPTTPGSPVGQCGVTSAWLQQRLQDDHGIRTTYCVGTVLINAAWTDTHCWLETGNHPDSQVMDLTADQLGLEPVLAATYGELAQRRIYYVIDRRLTAGQVTSDPVMDRLAVLTGALA